jgi:hypothetical protein
MFTPLYGIITLVSLNLPHVRHWARGVRALKRGVPPEQAFAPVAEPPVAKLAVVSLVCSILPFMLLTQVIGLFTGIIALSKIKRSRGTLGGRGMALAGTIISSVFLILVGGLITLAIVGSQLDYNNSTPRVEEQREVKVIHYP